jgi:hypothetical protein
MELTIEQILPYIPHQLEVQVLDFKSDYVGKEYDKIIGIHQWDKSGKMWSVLLEGGAKPSVERVKPLLFPLSCMVEEIEHNGHKFVPIIELARLAILDPWKGGLEVIGVDYYCDDCGCEVSCWVKVWDFDWELEFDKQGFRLTRIQRLSATEVNETGDVPLNQQILWQKLAEWCIDFQGLIDKGLALNKLEHGKEE